MKQPFFSIICPTKDRPKCVDILLKTISAQTFSDYEVIVSDNCEKSSCVQVVNEAVRSNERIRYIRPQECLGLSDSFEFAVQHAKGRYYLFVEDKTILYPDALQKLYSVLNMSTLDVLNFPWDFLTPYDSDKDIITGTLSYAYRRGKVEPIDLDAALNDLFSCEVMTLGLDKEWNYGAILGGCYSERFVNQIKSLHKGERFFEGIIPDRFVAVEALCIIENEKIAFLDDHILIYSANGQNTSRDAKNKGSNALKELFDNSRKEKRYAEFVFPDIYITHNILATDYIMAQSTVIDNGKFVRRNPAKLEKGRLLAIMEKRLNWFIKDEDEYRSILKMIKFYYETLSDEEKLQYNNKWSSMKKGPYREKTYLRYMSFPIAEFAFLDKKENN